MRALAAVIALALSAPLVAQEPPAWRAIDAVTGQIADVAGLEALARDFPDSGGVRLRLLNAYLGAGDLPGAMEALRWLSARGYSFSPGARVQIPALVGEAYAEEAKTLLAQQPAIIAASKVIAEVPVEAGLVESAFVVSDGEVVVAPSVLGKALHVRGPDGVWVVIPLPGANDLSTVVSAPDDSVGWIASANIDGSDDIAPQFTGLIGITGDFSNPDYVAAPAGAAVSDLVIAPDGTVYASDPIGGGVYRARRGAKVLDVLVAPGTFRSPQGLAVSADGQRLYLSDYRYGLAVVTLATATVTRLASDVPVLLDGVDGLWLHKGQLIAVQNGTSPLRISAFRLSEDGLRISGHRVLEQANPEWTEPLGGSVSGDALFYVGNGQWDRFDKGEPVAGKPAVPTQIRRLPLGQ